jgi:hypothetical protein
VSPPLVTKSNAALPCDYVQPKSLKTVTQPTSAFPLPPLRIQPVPPPLPMVRCSNAAFACFNVLTLFLGAAVFAGGVYLAAPRRSFTSAADCERLLRAPALVLGAALLVASAAGIAGACCRASMLLWLYLLLAALLVLAAVCFMVFALVAPGGGSGTTGSATTRDGCGAGWRTPGTGVESGAASRAPACAGDCRRTGRLMSSSPTSSHRCRSVTPLSFSQRSFIFQPTTFRFGCL